MYIWRGYLLQHGDTLSQILLIFINKKNNMKKLLLATGLFLSIGFMASAQEKKAAVKPATDVPAERMLTADEQRNKKKLKYIRKQKTIQRTETVNKKSTNVNNKAKEVKVD